jgi:hypothetical protein
MRDFGSPFLRDFPRFIRINKLKRCHGLKVHALAGIV